MAKMGPMVGKGKLETMDVTPCSLTLPDAWLRSGPKAPPPSPQSRDDVAGHVRRPSGSEAAAAGRARQSRYARPASTWAAVSATLGKVGFAIRWGLLRCACAAAPTKADGCCHRRGCAHVG